MCNGFYDTRSKKICLNSYKALPEVSIDDKWLADKFSNSITNLANAGCKVYGTVTDNILANVAAFHYLLQMFPADISLHIQHPENPLVSLFFDNVHLLKILETTS